MIQLSFLDLSLQILLSLLKEKEKKESFLKNEGKRLKEKEKCQRKKRTLKKEDTFKIKA